MEFNDSFFKQENRNGFLISSQMKKAWAAQMEVLSVVDKLCGEYGIRYYVGYGTLLGAVRHKGFIPWDDDIDIFLFRKEYDRFCRVAKECLPDPFELFNIHSEDKMNINCFSRVTNGREISFQTDYLKRFHGFPYVAGIDIFPLDALPNNLAERELQRQILYAIMMINRMLELQYDRSGLEDELHKLEELLQITLPRNDTLRDTLLKLQESVMSMYDVEKDEAKEVGVLADMRVKPFSVESFSEAISLPFETIVVPAPIGYDNVLKGLYGENYMMPKRVDSHDYPFYKKQEEAFREIYGYIPEF